MKNQLKLGLCLLSLLSLVACNKVSREEEPAASQESQEVKSGQTQPIVEDNADGASSPEANPETSSSQTERTNQEENSQEVPIDSQKPTINN